MANPALKNGYISVANELVEQFAKHNIPGNEMRILWVVWRKTWGWKDGDRKKDWDWISYSQFEKATGLKHADVGRCIKALVGKHLLLKKENSLKFNQNHDEWVVGKRLRVVGKHLPASRQTPTKISRQTPTYKRNKETNTKDIASSDAGLINQIIEAFKEVSPTEVSKWYGNKTQRGAVDRLIVEYGFEQVGKVVKLLPKTNKIPYFPSISTPDQLSKKWGQLADAFARKKGEQLTKVKNVLI